MADNLGKFQAPTALLTIAAIIPVFAVIGALMLILIAFFANLGGIYSPKGGSIDPTHAWYELRSGRRYGPATKRQVYEKYHGKGSWKRRVARIQKIMGITALVIAIIGASWLLMRILNQAENLVIRDFMNLVGSKIIAILVFLLAGAGSYGLLISGAIIYGASYPPIDEMHKYEIPSFAKIAIRLLPLLIALIMAIFLQLYSWLSVVQDSISTQLFRGAVSLFYLGLAFHWLSTAFPPQPKMKERYRREQSRHEMLEFELKLIQNTDCEEAMRIQAGIDLLRSGLLNYGGKNAIIKVMESISGKHYGDDIGKWESYQRWLN